MSIRRRLLFARKQAGISLLEVLIATLVLSVGLLGLAGLQIAGMKTTHNSYQMQQATWFVHELLERMRANRVGAFAGNYNNASNCANAKPTCATATACTAAEVASIDLYEIRCGSAGSGGIKNELMSGALTVSCVVAGCASGVDVVLSWQERNATQKGGSSDMENFNISLGVVL